MEFKSGLVAFALLTVLTLPGLSWGDDSASDPEELTPCEKMAAKCEKRGNKWGECLPRDNYNGDACCQKGSAWKCGIDMTVDERISKDPAYAKMINCVLAGHPDLESLKKKSLNIVGLMAFTLKDVQSSSNACSESIRTG
uniref:Venom protein n=1 Tax=Globodera pallida TaxID=36090 RepID=A0A183C9Z6_GLOPA